MNRPWFKFHPGDWRRDPGLAICSLAARAVWIELMGVMHDCVEYGVLSINGRAPTVAQITALVRPIPADAPHVPALLQELEDAGVFSRTPDGLILSRRMVRDEELSQVRADAGGKGADARWQTDGKCNGKEIATPRVRAGVRARARADSDSDVSLEGEPEREPAPAAPEPAAGGEPRTPATRSRRAPGRSWAAVLAEPEFEALRADATWLAAWREWAEYRGTLGAKYQVPAGPTARKEFRYALEVGPALHARAIDTSIRKGWKAIDVEWVREGGARRPQPARRSSKAHAGDCACADCLNALPLDQRWGRLSPVGQTMLREREPETARAWERAARVRGAT
jgi:hypothetical protein